MAMVLLHALPAVADERSLVCFGSEPSWSVVFEGGRTARLTFLAQAAVEYEGSETRLDVLRERMWRGAPTSAAGGDLVLFLQDADCSDGMSDQTHPVVARVSLPDGRMLAGCCRIPAGAAEAAGAAPAPAAAAPAAPAPIEGPIWRLSRLGGQTDQALAALRPPITARFDAGRLQAFGGCNQLVGGYVIDGDRVRVDALAGTMKACAPPVMAVETAFKAALRGTLRFQVEGDGLTLAAESDSEPSMTFAAAPPPRLEGITWTVSGYNNGRQAVVSPLSGTTLTLTFRDGSVNGRAGCNTFRATYSRDGNHLTIGAVAATRKTCAAAGVMQQEREFLAALESSSTWTIDRGVLDVQRADGARVLTARSEEAR
jgi:heat shock protein HslJ